MDKNINKRKSQIDYLQASSLRGLLSQVNGINETYPICPILKEDIVSIMKENDTFILVYYK